MSCFAHSHPDPDQPWEPLFTPFGEEEPACVGFPICEKCREMVPQHGHLNKVAWWNAKFMQDMFPEGSEDAKTAAEWGYLAGLWHDLGKFAPEWQEYLKKKVDSHIDEVVGKVDHSTAGAQHATKISPFGHFIAFQIMGHHCGLPDAQSNQSCLLSRLAKQDINSPTGAPDILLNKAFPDLPPFLKESGEAFACSFFIRMLFSCLVDADFLCTEAFMNLERSSTRNQVPSNVLEQIESLLSAKIEKFGEPKLEDIVNYQRAKVVSDCREAAINEPGFFSLTVPTGGGKTLSSLLFGLRHAIRNGQKRIIYVVPFTSIIEQNADVFRDIVGSLQSDSFTPLIEHHSSLEPDKETDQSRLATENWDAPIIITTAVQFYQSLYASKTSSSRKLHNIANSVVVLDEAQTLRSVIYHLA